MRKKIALSMCVMLFLLSFSVPFSGGQSDDRLEAMARKRGISGQYAPDFTLRMMDGSEFRLADVVGKKAIVLNFFATWCGPCKREMPELSSYYDLHREEPFVIIGVDNGEKEAKVKKFIAKYGVTFPVGIDVDDKIVKLYGVRSLPTTVLIGADGKVQLYEVGPIKDAAKSFDVQLGDAIELVDTGRAINKETYLEMLRRQSSLERPEELVAAR